MVLSDWSGVRNKSLARAKTQSKFQCTFHPIPMSNLQIVVLDLVFLSRLVLLRHSLILNYQCMLDPVVKKCSAWLVMTMLKLVKSMEG